MFVKWPTPGLSFSFRNTLWLQILTPHTLLGLDIFDLAIFHSIRCSKKTRIDIDLLKMLAFKKNQNQS